MEKLFTIEYIATYAGAIGAVSVLYNTYRRVAGRSSVLVALALASVVSFVGAYSQNALNRPEGYFAAVVNACLLFCTATGTQEVVAAVKAPAERAKLQGRPRARPAWWSSWIRGE